MKVLLTHATLDLGRRLTQALQAAGHEPVYVVCDARDQRTGTFNGLPVVRTPSAQAMGRALRDVKVAFLLCCSSDPHCEPILCTFAEVARYSALRAALVVGTEEACFASHQLQQRLRTAGVPVVGVRLAPLFGPESPLFELVRYMAERLPVIPCAKWMEQPLQPLAPEDAAAALVRLLADCHLDQEVVLSGPTRTTFHDLLGSYARARGLRRLMVPVPVHARYLSAGVLARLTPVPRQVCRRLIEQLAAGAAPPSGALQGRTSVAETLQEFAELDHPPLVRSHARADLNNPYHTVIRRTGFIIGIWETLVNADPAELFKALERIGGDQGWYFANELWQIRGAIDRLLGGPGMGRGRPHPERLEVGETLDFWRVEAVERNYLLRLRAEMKMPGRGWLEFRCLPNGNNSTLLRMLVTFEPHGLAGELYWTTLYPIHNFIFNGLHRELATAARRLGEPAKAAASIGR